jgi:hypothetical protein
MYIEVEVPNEKAQVFIEFLKSLKIVKNYEIIEPNDITINAMKEALEGKCEIVTVDNLKREYNDSQKN